jgi:hypothetical protein
MDQTAVVQEIPPEREIEIFRYLQSTNPLRYSLRQESFLEGMFLHFKLWDEEDKCFFGNELVYNCSRKEWYTKTI